MYDFCFYFLMFMVFSVIGWINECTYCSIMNKKLICNRGFLLGPYCPIHGLGTIYVYFLYKLLDNNIILGFITSIIGICILEYLTSYIMEKIFHARWWDYSDKRFNLNGRICLRNALMFGVLSILFSQWIIPLYLSIAENIPSNTLIIISCILMVIFIIDEITSFSLISKVKEKITEIKKDSTYEIDKEIKKIMSKYFKFLYKEDNKQENSR